MQRCIAHPSKVPHVLSLAHPLQAASLCTHTAYEPGQEVYDSYGPGLSPADLLLDYGFVDAANTNHRVAVDVAQLGEHTSGECHTVGHVTLWAMLHCARLVLCLSEPPPHACTPVCLPTCPTLTSLSSPVCTCVCVFTPAVEPRSSRARTLLAALGGAASGDAALVQAASPASLQLALSEDGPDAASLAWVRAALSSDADLIRGGERRMHAKLYCFSGASISCLGEAWHCGEPATYLCHLIMFARLPVLLALCFVPPSTLSCPVLFQPAPLPLLSYNAF